MCTWGDGKQINIINQYIVSDIVFAFCLHLSELEKPRAGWREGRTVEKDDLSSAHQDKTHKYKDTIQIT